MRLKTKKGKQAFFLFFVAAAGLLSVTANEKSLSGTGMYIDVASLGAGAAGKALLLQGGVSFPLPDSCSLSLEAEIFYTAPSDIYTLETAFVGIYRRSIFPDSGLYAGVGGGGGYSRSAVIHDAGSDAAYEDLRYKAIMLVETGYNFGFNKNRFYLEPFFRAYGIGGKNTRAGTAPASPKELDSWSAYFSGAFGLRAGLRLRTK